MMDEATEPRSRCGLCSKVWRDSELKEVDDLVSRVGVGDPMPSGQCPDPMCSGLCGPIPASRVGREAALIDWLTDKYEEISFFPEMVPSKRFVAVFKSAKQVNDWEDAETIEMLGYDESGAAASVMRGRPSGPNGFAMTPLYLVDLDTGHVWPVMSTEEYWIGPRDDDLQLDASAEKSE